MRILHASAITEDVRSLCLRACCDLPTDVLAALETAAAEEEPGSAARSVLTQLIENQQLARERRRPICQDTGVAVVFADIGRELHIEGDLPSAVDEGVRQAYVQGYLRKSVLDPITRVNTQDNTPATLHIRFTDGDKLRLTVAPKGFGSENMSRLSMLPPSAGTEGILDFIVSTVVSAGASACPPVVAGVGIGGTFEKCALMAKQALTRPVNIRSQLPHIRELEEELLTKINQTGIGPGGLGGSVTALAVNINTFPTHIAGLPVAVNMCCHVNRHAVRVI